VVDIGRATAGVRSYLAVAGGIAVEPVLGSRSTPTRCPASGRRAMSDGLTLPIGSLMAAPDRSGAVSPTRAGQGEE